MTKRIVVPVFAFLSLISSFNLFAQTTSTAALPKADGAISAGEYRYIKTEKEITLGVTLSPDGKTLHVAVSAPTAGWVSFGAGSLKMNGAYMVLAYDANGMPTVSEETGKGHGHSPNATAKLTASAVKEINGITTLETAFPATGYMETGSLKFIAAYGKAENLKSMHKAYFAVEVPVESAR